jgi:hypothetical protein
MKSKIIRIIGIVAIFGLPQTAGGIALACTSTTVDSTQIVAGQTCGCPETGGIAGEMKMNMAGTDVLTCLQTSTTNSALIWKSGYSGTPVTNTSVTNVTNPPAPAPVTNPPAPAPVLVGGGSCDPRMIGNIWSCPPNQSWYFWGTGQSWTNPQDPSTGCTGGSTTVVTKVSTDPTNPGAPEEFQCYQ